MAYQKTHGYGSRFKADRKPEYTAWCGMKSRCQNPNYLGYKYYGGRGITVCPEWQSFAGFFADMGARPKGKTLDRIDVNGNYEPGNCRWATNKEQHHNRRPFERRKLRPDWMPRHVDPVEWALSVSFDH